MRINSKTAILPLTLLAAACSDTDEITCGTGTTLEERQCVATGSSGAPGDGDGDGDGDGTGGGESTGGGEGTGGGPIVDYDPRSPTQQFVEETFEGALAAAPISKSAVLVAWEPLEVYGLSYRIYVAKDADDLSFGNGQFDAPEGASSLEIHDLDEGETYFIAVVPVLSGVELEAGRKPVKVVPTNDDERPAFVGLSSAKPQGGAEVLLEWDEAKDNETPRAAIRYFVYVGDDEDDPDLERHFAVSPPGATSLLVTGLQKPDHPYKFVVRASDAAGNLDDNQLIKRAKSGKDTTPPNFAGCTSAKAIGASTILVTWDPARDDIATASEITYNFYASKKAGEQNFSQITGSFVSGTQAEVSGLDNDTTYHIVCRAQDPSENEDGNVVSYSARTAADGEAPTVPVLTGTANVATRSLDLTWNPAEDNQTEGEDIRYILYLSTTAGELGEPAGDDYDGVAALVDGLSSHTTYYARIAARDEAGNLSEPSEEISFTTLVSLNADIEKAIFTVNCSTSGCHNDEAQGQLRLNPGWSYDYLVNEPATSDWASSIGLNRVEPGDPENSHLVHRIRNLSTSLEASPAFDRMPLSGDLLSEEQIATIEAWIEQGAKNN